MFRPVLFALLSITVAKAEFSLLQLQPHELGQLPETPTLSWNLGPTGLRGWVLGASGDSAASREILVVSVDKGSPADGLFQPFDILTGVGGKRFSADARKSFGEAIAPAEEGDGILTVTRWRQGTSEEIPVRIGKEIPAAARLAKAADFVAAGMPEKGFDGVFGSIDALFLLATGESKYAGAIRQSARRIAGSVTSAKKDPSLPNWEWSFEGIFLAEYCLESHDRTVLPALRQLVKNLENGEGASGSWGHSPATGGQTKGYGEVNAVGLPAFMALTLARGCGVEVSEEHFQRSRQFFLRYAFIGSIPYGDHEPWLQTHSANGKNAAAAVALNLSGDTEASRFFSRMTAASATEREIGHTGNFFSYLWAPAGVGLVGNEELQRFLAPQQWYYDLARRWDGGFITQPWPQKAEGKSSMKIYVSRGPVACTPSLAMAYAVPLRKLRIFGRQIK